MNKITKKPLHRIGYDFIVPPYITEGKDEYYLRNLQNPTTAVYRKLSAYEIEVLVKNENQSDNWSDIYVREQFDPKLVKNCHFHGLIRIGALESYYLEYHELQLPVGLYNSTIVSCDIGDNVVIKNVDYLAHYIIGNEVILFNINEMHATNHAKFGNGIVKEGEEEEVRIWLELANENGGRKILPFDGITTADAFLWTKYRDDKVLMERLREMTEQQFDARRGYYGTVGDRSVIKNTRILKDVKVGTDAYIKGGNKLKNLTVNSSKEAPSQIGEGVELVNGIMGYGSRAFYGVKAVRFVIGENAILKYGARLINSLLGDNSTISCCEVLNSLIYPAHEQHHNNSFLCAAIVMGQANMAAAATVGSNHNSRGADGELVAGRGFWPGLSTSLKHNSKFASFCLLAKAAYPAELDIPFPFSLVSNHESKDCLQIMPAYWFMYNMYALARNAWKYEARDKRVIKAQHIVFDYLAPDTVGEMFDALYLLERLVGEAYQRGPGVAGNGMDTTVQESGRRLLLEQAETVQQLSVRADQVEAGSRPVIIVKAYQAYHTYREMIHFYGVKTLLGYLLEKEEHLAKLLSRWNQATREKWVNLGGQLVGESDLESMKTQIRERSIASWEALHNHYDALYADYPAQNCRYALASLMELHGVSASEIDEKLWFSWLDRAVQTKKSLAAKTRDSRKKDYENIFRQSTYDNPAEMDEVLGTIDDNSFINESFQDAMRFEHSVDLLKQQERRVWNAKRP